MNSTHSNHSNHSNHSTTDKYRSAIPFVTLVPLVRNTLSIYNSLILALANTTLKVNLLNTVGRAMDCGNVSQMRPTLTTTISVFRHRQSTQIEHKHNQSSVCIT